MRILRVVVLLPCLLLLAGCGGLPNDVTVNVVQPTQDINQIVQQTFQAMTTQPQALGTPTAAPVGAATGTPSGATGSIAGHLTYPADSLPPMYVTAYQVGTQNYRYVITNAGQGTYQIDDLPAGTYHIVAYAVGGNGFPAGLSGAYTQAVLCGLTTGCDDHALVDVKLAGGQTVKDANPGDWYAPAGSFPDFPQAIPTSASSGAAGASPSVDAGSIAGSLMFPASGIPALRIVAFDVGSSDFYYTETTPGSTTYQLDGIPPGTYHVVAYSIAGNGFAGGTAGGYSQMVPCGLKYGCNDHTLIDVVVTSGNVTTGVDPNDYYADPGTFPDEPTP